MDEQIVLAASGGPDEPLVWLHRRGSECIAWGEADSLAAFAAQASKLPALPCWLLLPQERVLATTVSLPNGSRAARAAIPWQLEEQLAEDPEQLHFAVGRNLGGHRYPVRVVASAWVEAWLEAAQAAGLRLRGVVADAEAALADGEAKVLLLPERVWISNEERIVSVARAEADPWLALLDPEGRLPREELDAPVWPALASRLAPTRAVNLLQGRYGGRDPVRNWLCRWRQPLVWGAVALVLLTLSLGIEQLQLRQQKTALDEALVSIYREQFPDARRIVNAPVQMRQALESLRERASGEPLLRALERTLPAFGSSGVELERLRWDADAGTLQLSLKAKSLEQVQRFSAGLGQAGLQARVGSFSGGAEGGVGEVEIGGLKSDG